MKIEGFEYIQRINAIEEITLEELTQLLNTNNCSANGLPIYNNLNIKRDIFNDAYAVNSNGFLIYDTNTGNRYQIGCIKNYYMVDNLEDCFSITDFLRDKCESFSLSKCRDCHKCALDLYKNNKIKKII